MATVTTDLGQAPMYILCDDLSLSGGLFLTHLMYFLLAKFNIYLTSLQHCLQDSRVINDFLYILYRLNFFSIALRNFTSDPRCSQSFIYVDLGLKKYGKALCMLIYILRFRAERLKFMFHHSSYNCTFASEELLNPTSFKANS